MKKRVTSQQELLQLLKADGGFTDVKLPFGTSLCERHGAGVFHYEMDDERIYVLVVLKDERRARLRRPKEDGVFENPTDTAIRKCQEETGLTVRLKGWSEMVKVVHDAAQNDRRTHKKFFFVSSEKKGGVLLDSDRDEIRRNPDRPSISGPFFIEATTLLAFLDERAVERGRESDHQRAIQKILARLAEKDLRIALRLKN